jgi:hypothetical protein
MRLDKYNAFDEILADNKSLGLASCLQPLTAFPLLRTFGESAL